MQTRLPADDPLTAQRQALREQLLGLRASMPDRADRERVLTNRVRRWLATMPTSRLAFYWAVRGECDLRQVIAEWLAADPKRMAALPVIDGEVLSFASWTAQTPMGAGPFGIPVPPLDAPRVTPQVLLVPCVGVDTNRYRLGYGGGYYDRMLPTLPARAARVVGAFAVQVVDDVPCGPHDTTIDLLLTERGIEFERSPPR